MKRCERLERLERLELGMNAILRDSMPTPRENEILSWGYMERGLEND